jgi:hypothetical protein
MRPEQFFAAEVSGLAVPVVQLHDGKPAARWYQYLRWADGRRECRELANCIDLADGRRFWIHPVPGEPAMTTAAGWSTSSRRAWLDGAAAPNPADLFKRVCERIAYHIDLSSDTAAGTTATQPAGGRPRRVLPRDAAGVTRSRFCLLTTRLVEYSPMGRPES